MPYVLHGSLAHGALGDMEDPNMNRTLAIRTKYLRPTAKRGARIRAFTDVPGHRAVTFGYDHALSFEANCRAAAEECLFRNRVRGSLTNSPVGAGEKSGLIWIAVES